MKPNGPELPVAVAHAVHRARILLRAGIEDVLPIPSPVTDRRLRTDATIQDANGGPTTLETLRLAGSEEARTVEARRTT